MADGYARTGGNAAIVVGVLYVIAGITYFLLPEAQQGGLGDEGLRSLADDGSVFRVQGWVFVLSGVFGIGVVVGVDRWLHRVGSGLVRWAGGLAFLGFAVTIIDFLRTTMRLPEIASFYVAVDDETVQQMIRGDVGLLALDNDGLVTYGAVGLWVLAVSLVAAAERRVPRALSIVGLGVAVLYWVLVVGIVVEQDVLIAIAAGLGGVVLAPVFYIWLGVVMRRESVANP